MPGFLALFVSCFIAGISFRLTDPLVSEIARDFNTTPAAAAMLTTAYMLPYALALPFVGSLGDRFGKLRMIAICLAGMTLATVFSALAPTYEILFASRVVAGMIGGPVIPLSLAVVGDRYPFSERQVALARLLMAMITAQIIGMSAAGFIADSYGWRNVIWMLVGLSAAGIVYLCFEPSDRETPKGRPMNFRQMLASYGALIRIDRARICYIGSFLDGLIVFGMLPWIAIMLEMRGLGSTLEAGFVLGAMGFGGVFYVLTVRRLLKLTGGVNHMIWYGGVVAGLGYLAMAAPSAWYLQAVAFSFAAIGYYMIHASFQTVVSEVAPDMRGAAVGLNSTCFLLGQALGPIMYAVTIGQFGIVATLLGAAVGIAVLGTVVGAALHREEVAGERE